MKLLLSLALVLGLALPSLADETYVRFDGHRVKKLKEKIKAKWAKVKPKTPEVKPVDPKPAPKPSVKGNHRGRFGIVDRVRERLGRRHRPDYTPDGPRDHPSLKPVPSEKLPLPKPSKVPGVPDKPAKPKTTIVP